MASAGFWPDISFYRMLERKNSQTLSIVAKYLNIFLFFFLIIIITWLLGKYWINRNEIYEIYWFRYKLLYIYI